MSEDLNTIIDLLTMWDPRLRAEGFSRLESLSDDARGVLAATLLTTNHDIRWQAVARCLMDRDTASRRLRLFAARCALHRLEAERDAGREPMELVWRAAELAERLARGPVSLRELMDARESVMDFLFDEHEGFYGALDDGDPGSEDSAFAAAKAAALAIQEEEPTERWAPYNTIVAPAASCDERDWQSHAFDHIVLRGEDLPQLRHPAVA